MTKNTHLPTPGEAFRSDLHERLPKRSARAGIIDQKIDGAELLADALESCRYLDRTAGINSVAPGYPHETDRPHRVSGSAIKGDAQECGKESTGSVRRDGQRVQVRGPSQILNRGVFDHDPPSRSSTHSEIQSDSHFTDSSGRIGLDAIRRSECGDHSVFELYLILAFDSGPPGLAGANRSMNQARMRGCSEAQARNNAARKSSNGSIEP